MTNEGSATSGGYTYTSITSEPGQPMRIGVSFHLDRTAWIRAVGLDSERPHLTIDHGDVNAHVAPALGPITQTDAQIARELADQAALYADALQRLASTQDAEARADAA
jgi:hypothetical protein